MKGPFWDHPLFAQQFNELKPFKTNRPANISAPNKKGFPLFSATMCHTHGHEAAKMAILRTDINLS